MALASKNLVRLSYSLREAVSVLGGDPDFVNFILAWYGLLGHETPQPIKWQYWSTAAQQKRKRELQRRYGKNWKDEWKKQQAEAKSYDSQTRFRSNLFLPAELAHKSGHNPFKWDFWFALSDVQNYFRRLTGKPHWSLVQDVFFPHVKQSHGYAQNEYSRRKKELKRFAEEGRLDRLISFYLVFQPVILKVLASGTPMWLPPHREEAQEILNKLGPNDLQSVLNPRKKEATVTTEKPGRKTSTRLQKNKRCF